MDIKKLRSFYTSQFVYLVSKQKLFTDIIVNNLG